MNSRMERCRGSGVAEGMEVYTVISRPPLSQHLHQQEALHTQPLWGFMEVSLRSWLTEFVLNSTFSSPRIAGAQKKKDKDQTYISSYEPQQHSGPGLTMEHWALSHTRHFWEWGTKHLGIITQPETGKSGQSFLTHPEHTGRPRGWNEVRFSCFLS